MPSPRLLATTIRTSPTKMIAVGSTMQIRRYAQAATAPSPEDNIDTASTRRARNPDAAQYPFPSKKNPSPYEILHLPTSADPKDIKQRCKSVVPHSQRKVS